MHQAVPPEGPKGADGSVLAGGYGECWSIARMLEH